MMQQTLGDCWAVVTILHDIQKAGKARLVWCGDYGDEKEFKGMNLYKYTENYKERNPEKELHFPEEVIYIINHSKHQFIDLRECQNRYEGHLIHPLPILTRESTMRGGGDFFPSKRKQLHYVGLWARDVISISPRKPDLNEFKKIKPNFEYGDPNLWG
jgi:hypothetical protein